mgnify:CR=1 FL=1
MLCYIMDEALASPALVSYEGRGGVTASVAEMGLAENM